jgi:predicted  nucleic acid-binding Zn-ribbon protein
MNIKEIFTAKLEECYEALSNGEVVNIKTISQVIQTQDELRECLPLIKEEQTKITQGISDCDHRIKSWQETKKAWKSRQENLSDALQDTMTNLGIKTITDGSAKVTMTTKTNLNLVSPDEILKQYEAAVETLRQTLPPYIKLSIDIDKTQLNSYLKQDNTLLLTMPESINYKESKSIKIS